MFCTRLKLLEAFPLIPTQSIEASVALPKTATAVSAVLTSEKIPVLFGA